MRFATHQNLPNANIDHFANANEHARVNDRPRSSGLALDQTIGVDYNRINKMIESNLSRMLQNMNLQSNPTQFHNSGNIYNHGSGQPPHAPPPPQNANISNHNLSLNNSENTTSVRTDKITSLIRNWNIKFDGSNKALSVDEFIYRITSMTKEHLNGNFDIVCGNLPVLLADKALHWYWRYHKKVAPIRWGDFCIALKYEYKDMRSNYDLREEIRNRKMRPGESFEIFYDSICSILDRLETPMVEAEIVEILVRNLRPDIRHELLYVPVYSIAHLRKLVQMRENLFSDDIYRRHMLGKNSSSSQPLRRNIAEVVGENKDVEIEDPMDQIDEINQNSHARFTCFNCEEPGHHWEDCLQERKIFCYGCGMKNVYKPQCTKCGGEKSRFSKNYLRPKTTPNLP